MKRKVLGVVLVLAGLTCVGVIHSASKHQNAKNPQNDRIGTYKERLQRAKARGDKKLLSYGVIPLYATVNLDQALEIYDLVLALDPAKQAGTVEVGPSGALLVKSDDTMEPAAKNRAYFKNEIENRYGASVSKLKEKLK